MLGQPLTKSELRVAQVLAEDRTEAEVGEQLGLVVGTVKVYVCHMIQKLGVRSRVGIAAWWIKTYGSSQGDRQIMPVARYLSAREKMIVALIAEDRSDKEIAERLKLTRLTVKSYVSRIIGKLQHGNVRSRTGLAVWWLRSNLTANLPPEGSGA